MKMLVFSSVLVLIFAYSEACRVVETCTCKPIYRNQDQNLTSSLLTLSDKMILRSALVALKPLNHNCTLIGDCNFGRASGSLTNLLLVFQVKLENGTLIENPIDFNKPRYESPFSFNITCDITTQRYCVNKVPIEYVKCPQVMLDVGAGEDTP